MKKYLFNKNKTLVSSKQTEEKELLHLDNQGEDDFRVVGLYGDVNEENCKQALYGLISLHETREKYMAVKPSEEELKKAEENDSNVVVDVETIVQPIDFFINTPGGAASDMFALYDAMRMIREDCDINTIGLGRVMSAGVLLLAAGTKGKRKIGKYCRVMIHSVSAGAIGNSHVIKNEVKEIESTEKMYIQTLASETNMTKNDIKKLFAENRDIYLSAKEAVDMGIADIII